MTATPATTPAGTPAGTAAAPRAADAFMRRLLRVPAPDERSVAKAQSAMSTGIAASAIRCTLTYIVLPLLRPVIDLSGGVGPVLGLVVGAVSVTAVTWSARRFWAAEHRWRWGYSAVALVIVVMVAVQSAVDVSTLVGG